MLVNPIIKLVNYITSFHLLGTRVTIDRKETQNIAVSYLSVNVNCLSHYFFSGFK